jgi:hypothetical protein
MALCLAAAGVVAQLATASFTLAWTHSVERVRWEEDWRVVSGSLALVEARVRGSGAGMEPPNGAVLEDGFWRYRPDLAPLPRLELARGGAVPDWQLCVAGRCRELAGYLPTEARAAPAIELHACGG